MESSATHSTFLNNFEDLDIKILGVRLPEIKIPENYIEKYGKKDTADTLAFMKRLCNEGYKRKVENKSKEYVDRVRREIEIIDEIGFTDYIILVWDVINFCNERDIPVGKGRGSAAGSLVLYLLDVTDIDPIQNNLIFERFISKVRAKSQVVDGVRYIDGSLAPDVDLDICTDRRDEVIHYLGEKYPGRFCKLPTISTLKTKQVVKDACKIYRSLSEDDALFWTKQVQVKYGIPHTITETLEENQEFKDFCNEGDDGFLECALTLEKMMRQKGSHASAFLVSYDNLDDFLPCEMDQHGELTSSWDMNYAQKESIKLDLLGLHGVTLVDRIRKSCLDEGQMSGADIESFVKACGADLEKFDPNDPKIYQVANGRNLPYGLFQIGADANFRVFQQVKPKNWEQLSAVIALARPGALAYVDDYCANKHDDLFNNEALQKILAPTHNVPLYQEQLMRIAHEVFGFTLEEAEMLRRIVGKKKVKEMAEWEPKVYQAAENLGLDKGLAEFYWNLLNESANYSFNASHSYSYSYLSALTLYLKYNHPQEFYCECLKMAENKSDSQEHVAQIEAELKEFGIKLLPPDFLKSSSSFVKEGGDIRYGFSCIKGVSEKSLPNLRAFLDIEKTNKFEVFNAAQQAKLNVGILSALVQAGMLNSVGGNREKLVFEAQLWNLLTPKEQTFCLTTGADYDYDLIQMVRNIKDWTNDDGKKVAAKTRPATIEKRSEKYREIYKQNTEKSGLASWFYETKLLGYSYSTTLKKVFAKAKYPLTNIKTVKSFEFSGGFYGVYEVADFIKGVSKGSGQKYIKLILRDENGTMDAMFFGEKYENYLSKGGDNPKKGSIVSLQARKDDKGDISWIERLSIQDNKIYMKLSDIK